MPATTFHLPSPRTLCIALGLAASPAMASVTFFDGTFNDADWSLTTITNANGAASTVQGFQLATGGNGGSHRTVIHQMVVTGQYALVTGLHMNANATYDPSTQGGFSTIDYSEDAMASLGLMGTGLAILQDGNFYVLRKPSLMYAQGSWNTVARTGIVATDLYLIDSNGNFDQSRSPDFSAAGGVMQFGFWRANGSGTAASGTFNYETGIDNWSVTLVVPSPGALALVGLAGLIGRRRRN
jgi:hypothetical protein